MDTNGTDDPRSPLKAAEGPASLRPERPRSAGPDSEGTRAFLAPAIGFALLLFAATSLYVALHAARADRCHWDEFSRMESCR